VVVAAAQTVRSRRLTSVTFKNLPTPLEDVVAAAAQDQGLTISQNPEGIALAFKPEAPDTPQQLATATDTTTHKPSESPDDAVSSEDRPERTEAHSTADSARPETSKHRTTQAEGHPKGDDAELKIAYCVKCGDELPDAVHFCVSCGTAVDRRT
jgi:hypothetical protein